MSARTPARRAGNMRHREPEPGGFGRVFKVFFGLVAIGVLAMAVIGTTFSGRDEAAREVAATVERPPMPAPAAPAKPSPALAAYERAKVHVRDDRLRQAVEALQEAISHDKQFGEAWYQLGAAQANLAIERVRSNPDLAVSMMEEAVRSKKHARNLINSGELRVWTPEQTAQARSDLDNALADIDEVMRDRESLIAAMEMWARAR